ncbi:MAG TPA: TIGR02186 family protein, partial [Hyphomicrobium sp.]|nr:TIGR02186 family protein [Hyphomicrobium sp.]HRO48986.1 TIGR02186 family protein [Hyphomicrobium sp.]
MRGFRILCVAGALCLALAGGAWPFSSVAATQTLARGHEDARRIVQRTPKAAPAPAGGEQAAPLLRETVEADVSSRAIAITSAFTGTEIVVFGSVLNSRQPSAEAGYYDVIVVLEGVPEPVVARRKSNVAGLWVNTDAFDFESAPSYYAIASTRPIEEIADESFLEAHAIGLDYVRLSPAARSVIRAEPAEIKSFKEAVVRRREHDGLYLKADYAVIFIGKSLFRASIALPAHVPVGPLTARVYLFREGEVLSTFQQRVRLEREGVELWIYWFAMRHPALYGLFTVMIAVIAGLLASAAFRRKAA